MKKILGLDLGTNSIGWALVETDFEKKEGRILNNGVRIIPMNNYFNSKTGSASKDPINEFGGGIGLSITKGRTKYRSVRKLYQRDNLRRERLHRVLNILGFLPKHYVDAIDFEKQYGQFKRGKEIKLNYFPIENGKDEFVFKSSFLEMVVDFKKVQPKLFYIKKNGKETKIPYDWTIYYLRKKALTQKITKEELSWLLLNFNQKRGYYQLRGEEEEEKPNNKEEFYALVVTSIEATEDKNAKGVWYNVNLDNGFVYRRQSKEPLNNWIGKTKEFIVTTQLEADGSPKKDKEGNIRRSFRMPKEDDWNLVKTRTEQDIDASGKYVGEYIYDTLLQYPNQKINGKLIKTIERKFYKKELKAILKEQISHHPELMDRELYQACVEELYANNEAHKNNVLQKAEDEMFRYLFMDDIIFYQRPLKSKKSSIANCPYEYIVYIKNDEKIEKPLKVISKSNPYFIEFRLWQFIHNLRIYQIEDEKDVDVTQLFFATEEDWTDLFDYLNDRKEVEQKNIIDFLIKNKGLNKTQRSNYRWNYVTDRKYPINETRAQFLNRLKNVNNIPEKFLTKEVEYHLWHIVYSVKDKLEFERALGTFANNYQLDVDSFVDAFKKHPPYASDYGAYSEKAIKKLLPLMRRGKYWNKAAISIEVAKRVKDIYERIDHLKIPKHDELNEKTLQKAIDLVSDDVIPKQFIKSFLKHEQDNPLTALNTYQACYAVYERHSEVSDITIWNSPKDIDLYLESFKQHSLRNPIVEQVVTETLRTVRDIWQNEVKKDFNFKKFDEIHVELGREIKNSADKRKKISEQQAENERTNERIKLLLEELKNEGAKSFSPSHQEILKIYEEGVTQNPNVLYDVLDEDEVVKIRKNTNPSLSEIKRYKLWLEQKYISPYSGKPIPLSKLFTSAYEIEHIIPQSRYFDDSLTNKVICEADINRDKGNKTAYEYIKEKGGSIVEGVQLFPLENYEEHCKRYFKNNRTKLKNLLSEDIPEGFINRQMNDSRYISKLIKSLLSNIVRDENEKEATSKKLVPVSGAITAKLKQDWGLNEQWNKIIQPRFERLNEITSSSDYGYLDFQKDEKGNNVGKQFFRITPPVGINKKRIDHRHHTLDAIIIACCTRDHTNYITSLETERKNHTLVKKLCNLKTITFKGKVKEVFDSYKKPWQGFTLDVLKELETTIISFKQNTRVLTKANNKTWQWEKDKNGQLKKVLVPQKGDSRAIRKALHKETVYGAVKVKQVKKGLVNIKSYIHQPNLIIDKKIRDKVKALNKLFNGDKKEMLKHLKENPIVVNNIIIEKIQVWEWTKNATASRIKLSDKFTRKQLESITDSGIVKILENHIKQYIDKKGKERFDLAFNPEGVDTLNKNIVTLNNGKFHQPILSVRVYEEGSRFAVSKQNNQTNKSSKFVEAAKGTNLFFAIYWDEKKQQRVYETIPLNDVIDWQKWRTKNKRFEEPMIPVQQEKGDFLFSLSPNDLVYVPTKEEQENPTLVNFDKLTKEQTTRVYKMVSSSGNQCFFIQSHVANVIENKKEFSALNKMEKDINDIMIKSICRKLKADRLGNITRV